MKLNRLFGIGQSPKVKPPSKAAAKPEAPPPSPADSYEPAKGVGWGRAVGKVTRWGGQGFFWGSAGVCVLAAAGAPAIAAGALLAFSGAMAYVGHRLGGGNVSFTQGKEFSETFHSTLQTDTSLSGRKSKFAELESALKAVDSEQQSYGERVKGTRKAKVKTDEKSGLTYLHKAKETGSKLRRNVPRYSENKRELAAYLVDKRLGHYARVPPSVPMGEEGLATFIVDDAVARDDSMQWIMSKTDKDGYRRLAIFDNIIGNLDRHPGNFLTTKEGRVVPIDHGLAFPTNNNRQDPQLNFSFDKEIRLTQAETLMLSNFSANREAIAKDLGELLEPEAITAMFARVDKMLAKGSTDDSWRKKALI